MSIFPRQIVEKHCFVQCSPERCNCRVGNPAAWALQQAQGAQAAPEQATPTPWNVRMGVKVGDLTTPEDAFPFMKAELLEWRALAAPSGAPKQEIPAQTGMLEWAKDALQNIRDTAYFDASVTGDMYYGKAENALARIECRDALSKSELTAEPASTVQSAPVLPETFQARVQPWLMECFGPVIAADHIERNHRFLEESLELVQSCGCTADEAHQLVEYVYGRPIGVVPQEVGGVMVTLAALCLAQGIDMHDAGEAELARIWTKVDAIRAKQAAKPKHSPLPAAQKGGEA